MKLGECGWCCGLFSTVGAIFLFVLYEVLKSGSPSIHIEEAKRGDAADSALYGAFIYIFFIAISIGCVLVSRRRPLQPSAYARF